MALRYKLDNGLTVVFEEQHAAKVAAFQVWVKVGSADERPDQAGLAHLHEHMLFKGTERRGPGEMAHAIEAHGGEINAWTSFDQTVYHVVMASQFAQQGLDILGDAVRHPAFDPDELAREIEVVCEEIKRSEDSPGRRASRELFTHAFQTHPYRAPVIGTEQSVRSFSRDKVLEFYRRHYTPENMVLSVVGDLTEDKLRVWVEEIFGGDWKRRYEGRFVRPAEPPHEARTIRVKEDDVKEVYLNLAFPIPAVDHPDTPALDVLAMLMGQGDSSRLSLEVKRKRSLVNDIHAYAYTPQDPGIFVMSMTLQAPQLTEALGVGTRTLLQLTRLPVPAAELATVKAIIEAEAVYQREAVQGIARKLGFYATSALGLEGEAQYYERVAALTPEQIRDAAARYLRLDRSLLTLLVPAGAGITEAALGAVLDEAQAAPVVALPERKLAKPLSDAPMRIPTATSGRGGTSGILVEKLPSGATIVVREERAVPLFAIRGAFLGGVRYETEADNGLTALLSRMLTRGTAEHDAEQISHLVDDLAGSLSGVHGRNSVNLRGEFLSKHFDRAFSLFTECLTGPTFPEAELARERALMLQDIHTREDKPSGLAFELFAKTLFTRHPNRLSQLGEKASLDTLTVEHLARYHGAYMDPSQMTLCVVGDVKADEVFARAHEAFGKTRGKAAPPPQIPMEPALTGPRTAKKTLARAQSHLVLGFLGGTVKSPWRYALDVMSTILSGQGGRLFVELRDKRSMAYSVSSFSTEGVDPGSFAVYMGTSPEKVDAALEGIKVELRRIREEKVSPAELSRAKEHLIGTHEIGLQRNGARAGLLALDHLYDVGTENFLHYAEMLNGITVEDVQGVAQRLIDFEKSALAIVGP